MAAGRYVAYYRVSTAAQGRSGLGLEAQQAAVRSFLNGGCWSLLGEFIEVESGANNARPELAKALDAFVRGFATYYPRNPNAAQGYVAPSYAIANLYLGVRDPKSAWEGSLFVKNIGNRTVLLNRSPFQIQEQGGLNAVFGSPGYYSASFSGGQLVTAPMQIGVNLRYAFGSR